MMKKLVLGLALAALGTFTQAGWFANASEAYLQQWRHIGNNTYNCVYRTNPGGRGWMNFQANFQGGCPRFVHYNAQNGQVTVPN